MPSASARSRRLQTPGRVSPRLRGARLRPGRGPSCQCLVAPAGARSPAPGLRRPQPGPGPGGFRRLGASPRASEERASGRAGGRAANAWWPPRALARQPPACAALSLGPVQAASNARVRLPAPRRNAPQARLVAELPMRGGPLGRSLASHRPAPSSPGRTASPPPSGSHVRSAGASMRQAVVRPSVLSGCVLRLRRRRATRRPQPARFPSDSRPRGKTPPGYVAATARLTPRARLDLGPVQAASDTRARLPAPRRSAPQAGLGAELPMRGGPLGRSLASPRPAPSSPGRTASPPPSGSHVRSAGASMRQAVARPSVLSASALPLGRPPPRKDTSRLRGGHRSPHAPGPSRRDGAPAPGYGCPTAGRRPMLGFVGVRSWRPGRRQRPCHRALWVLTRWDCPILYVPQCAPAKTEALLPSRFREGEERPPPLPKWEGRREASSSPPVFGKGGASGVQAGGLRPCPGSRLGAAHLRTGGEEECTGTADTNPGCNYLVRGYNPSMHYFWRGDMPHFSSPLPFQRGARGCRAAAVPRPLRRARRWPRPARSGHPQVPGCGGLPTPSDGGPSTSAGQSGAVAVPRPPRPARSCAPSISSGMAPLADARQRTPLQTGIQPGAARAAQVRWGVTAAISNWPATPAAGQPQQARPPRRRRPCPIFTLLLILLTTPS